MIKKVFKFLDKQSERIGNFLVSKRHIATPIFSLTLGGITGFFIRDEMNYPTYLRI